MQTLEGMQELLSPGQVAELLNTSNPYWSHNIEGLDGVCEQESYPC